MTFQSLNDRQLLEKLKDLRQNERQLLTDILHHLREVERRRLYSELGYQSLFAYAVEELSYSEGQAGRRLSAMRLLKDLPELESKIKDGSLNLTHLSQAQRFINETAKESKPMIKEEKLQLLFRLENKTSREAEKTLFSMNPRIALPKERERQAGERDTEMRFLINVELRAELEEVRSLLGPSACNMSFAELISAMAKLSVQSLTEKKFGKKRVAARKETSERKESTTAPSPKVSSSQRHIPRSVRYTVWKKAEGKCENCGSKRNLQFDHVKPVAMGGQSSLDNLRLLCFHCNQRGAVKVFGVTRVAGRLT